MKPGGRRQMPPPLPASLWGDPGWDLNSAVAPRCQSWLAGWGMIFQRGPPRASDRSWASPAWGTQAGSGGRREGREESAWGLQVCSTGALKHWTAAAAAARKRQCRSLFPAGSLASA